MNPNVKRWLILLACIAANLCQGLAYSSSIYMIKLGEALNRPTQEWSREWGLIFACSLCFMPLGMIVSGKMADAGRTRSTMLIGSVCYGMGVFLAGFSNSVLFTAFFQGVLPSFGAGFLYGTAIGAAVRWFPDHRGLASGLAVAAVGASPGVLAPIARFLMTEYGVMNMLKVIGLSCIVVMGLASLFVVNPPADYVPAGWTPPEPALTPNAATADGDSLHWRQMIALPLFWLLYAGYFCGAFTGILVSSLAAPIAIELAGFTEQQAMLPVMLFSLANTGGRFIWGYLSDKFGRIVMIGVSFTITAASMFLLYTHVRSPGYLLPCVVAAGLCYGGVFGTYPSLLADSFGVKYAAVNLSVAFTAFSIGSLVAPQVAGHYRMQGAAEYPKAFLAAGCIAVAGVVLSILIARLLSARKAAGTVRKITGE